MIINRTGEIFAANGKEFTVGGMVWANTESDYSGLFGHITEIRDGDDKDTDNNGTDIYCDFMIPRHAYMVRNIETHFSALWLMPKHIGELSLGSVIMAPEMLEPVAESVPVSGGTLYVLTYFRDSGTESAGGVLALSDDCGVLMRKMFDDLEALQVKAVLSHSQKNENGSEYLFEAAEVAEDDFCIRYAVTAVPIYRAAKGGAAA